MKKNNPSEADFTDRQVVELFLKMVIFVTMKSSPGEVRASELWDAISGEQAYRLSFPMHIFSSILWLILFFSQADDTPHYSSIMF